MSPSSFRLNILVVGAGLGGLSAAISCVLAGHHVLVLEGAKQLAEIGAGLQLTPNATRLLRAWGLKLAIEKVAAEPTFLAVHRYANGKVLAFEEDFNSKMRAKYGAPFLDMHRVDLQKMLYARAVELGVEILFDARVAKVDLEEAMVTLESGEKHTGDLVVGADGLWSRFREAFLGRKDSPLPTGDLAYRIMLSLDQISDPELRDWVSKPSVHFWIGPYAHAVGYSVRSGTMYNLVLLCPDDLPQDVSRQVGSEVDKWKLMHRAEMETWTNEKGNFVLIGDACHPMLPYLAQGANSSIEDGGVLGRVLGRVEERDQLKEALRTYQELRKVRSEAIMKEKFCQREAFHMPDGLEQRGRDEVFGEWLGKEVSCKFPSRWTCGEVQPWIYGYDAYKEVDAALEARAFT